MEIPWNKSMGGVDRDGSPVYRSMVNQLKGYKANLIWAIGSGSSSCECLRLEKKSGAAAPWPEFTGMALRCLGLDGEGSK